MSCEQTTTQSNSTGDSATTKTVTPIPSQPVNITYRAMSTKDLGVAALKNMDSNRLQTIYTLNRVDKEHLSKIDTLIIPDNVQADVMQYSIFPKDVPALQNVNKIIFFSYPAEAFAAYDHGKLVRWGATNMGRKKDPTPTGLTYANWKKEVDTSSVKDEWILKWNVNILNKDGVGFHEYDLPGYPASHSCLRLMDADAAYLYQWVDQWTMKGTDDIKAHGTPVMVFGAYPFGGRKPWLALAQNPHALDMSANDIQALIQPNLQEIMTEQQKTEAILAAKSTASK
ncbi:MAG: L,D-transpeptidase family protein [Flavipsychrobacter sp.]|nr:L,D-transpeptidase family protein [Flavipsychrobacter sp.]